MGAIKKTMLVEVPSFEELFKSLNEEQRTDAVEKELFDYYQREKQNLFNYALGGNKPSIYMGTFNKQGSQWIAEFAVNDLELPFKADSYNFHLQNTSQWLYAGAILVQDGQVSTHH